MEQNASYQHDYIALGDADRLYGRVKPRRPSGLEPRSSTGGTGGGGGASDGSPEPLRLSPRSSLHARPCVRSSDMGVGEKWKCSVPVEELRW